MGAYQWKQVLQGEITRLPWLLEEEQQHLHSCNTIYIPQCINNNFYNGYICTAIMLNPLQKKLDNWDKQTKKHQSSENEGSAKHELTGRI